MTSIRITESNGWYNDYSIVNNGIVVGILQTVEREDSIFIRQVHIYDKYTRNGFASKAIDAILEYDKTLRFCIATNSRSAEPFWMSYMEKCKSSGYVVTHIRGTIYEISK